MNELFPIIKGGNELLHDFFIRNYTKKVTVERGKDIILYPDYYALLYKGLAKTYMADDRGNERLMWFLEESNLIPNQFMDIFGKKVVAEIKSEILYVEKYIFYKHIISNTEYIESILYEQLYKRHYLLIQEVLNKNVHGCEAKINKFIYHLANMSRQANENNQIVIKRLPSRLDIASIIGTHKSNV